VAALLLHGNTSVSTPALLALMRRGAPVLWHGFDGRLVGQTLGLGGQPAALREAQYAAAHGDAALAIARALVGAKLANSRRLLIRRLGAGDSATRQLASLAARAAGATSLDQLRGLEGAAARAYFASWPRLLAGSQPHLQFAGRTRRPPADPLNAALSYLYAVLHGRCVAAAIGAGLDPMAGFLHERRAGRSALALDLMEPFRPLLVDAPLIAAANNGELPPTAFETAESGGWRLNAAGRRAALSLFERRLSQRSRERGAAGQPTSGQPTYRDAVFRQARLLAACLRQGRPFVAFTPAN
jgi:CRISPR-associated protein Cas1